MVITMGITKSYPLVNVYISMERSTFFQHLGKLTISFGKISAAHCNKLPGYQRVSSGFPGG